MKKNLNVLVPEDLYEKAMEKARALDLTLSYVVRRALREFVENEEEEGDAIQAMGTSS